MVEIKTVILVEDDPDARELIERRLSRYGLVCLCADNAGDGLRLLREQPLDRVAALVLDIMLPYGDAREALCGEDDLRERESGISLLTTIRSSIEGGGKLWIAVVTSRPHPNALQRIEEVLGSRGRLYRKPLDIHRFEHETASALGFESMVPLGLRPEEGDVAEALS